MILATTAIKDYWGDSKELLLAGEWCKLGNDRYLVNRNYKIVGYPWNDRKRLYSAYVYTKLKYKIILPILVDWLNCYHNKSYSVKYWDIRLGLWLRYYIQILYDHYNVIKDALEYKKGLKTIITKEINIIPNDFNEFFGLYTTDHLYNFNLFCQIIEICFEKSKIICVDVKKSSLKDVIVNNQKVMSRLNKIGLRIPIFKSIDNNLCYYAPGYNFSREAVNALTNCMVPTIGVGNEINVDNIEINYNERKTELNIPIEEEFDEIISKTIKKHIPKTYLECDNNFELYFSHKFKKPPKYFITGNPIIGNENLKTIIALACEESKTKLVLHQHGGQYGAAKIYPLEDHETSISDYYLTWGWKSSKENIKPHNSIIHFKKRKISLKKQRILILSVSSPPYTKYFYSAPLSSQITGEFQMLIKALDGVKLKIRKNTYFRLKKEYGWGENKMIKSTFPEIQLETTKKKLSKSLSSTSLCIVTYNATVLLESFSMNVPTLLFWKKEYREIRDDAVKYYNMLENIGILHFEPESFSEKINDIADEPVKWWSETNVQTAKDEFLSYFCRPRTKLFTNYKSIINK